MIVVVQIVIVVAVVVEEDMIGVALIRNTWNDGKHTNRKRRNENTRVHFSRMMFPHKRRKKFP